MYQNHEINHYKKNLHISVEDDGKGFLVTQTMEENLSLNRFGLFSINEQIKSIGGILEIQSTPGNGTRAVIQVPLPVKEKTSRK